MPLSDRQFTTLALLALATGVAYYLGAPRESRHPRALPLPPASTTPTVRELSPERIAARAMPPVGEEKSASSSIAVSATPPPVPLSRTMPLWEQQIETLAAQSGTSAAERARTIFALLPGLPEEALTLAAERAIERLPDADYPATALDVVTDAKTHGRAMSVLFADLMERPDFLTLPALLRIASNPAHPFSEAARDNLELLLQADFDQDWPRWEAAIRQRLTPPK